MANPIYTDGVDLLAFSGRGFIAHVVVSNPSASATDNVILHDHASTDGNAIMTVAVPANDTVDIGSFDVTAGLWVEHSSTDMKVTVMIA